MVTILRQPRLWLDKLASSVPPIAEELTQLCMLSNLKTFVVDSIATDKLETFNNSEKWSLSFEC